MRDFLHRKIVVDGNDGTGKSTLVRALTRLGFTNVSDRGEMTLATDDPTVRPDPDTFYILLDCSVETSLKRLKERGADMEDHYHQPDVLEKYNRIYERLHNDHGPWKHRSLNVSTEHGSPADTLQSVLNSLKAPAPRVGLPSGKLHLPEGGVQEMFGAPYDEALEGRQIAGLWRHSVRVICTRSKSYPRMVALGALDVAVVGTDVLEVSPFRDSLEVIDRWPQERVRVCLVAPEGWSLEGLERPLRIATPFPAWASNIFGVYGTPHVTFEVKGGSEGMVRVGIADVCFDIVETGRTVEDNGLTVVEDFGELETCLIRRKS